MEEISVCFQYKGQRDYIHGTDMYNELITHFSGNVLKNIKFSVHGFIRDPRCLLYVSECKISMDTIEGIETRCQLDVDGSTHWMGLKPLVCDDCSEAGRYPYDEDGLVNLCQLDKETISLPIESPYTFIETIVAMNKRLLQILFPDANGKWVFTRIDLPELSSVRSKLAVRFMHNMNYRLLKSDILVDDIKAGDLYFSLVKL